MIDENFVLSVIGQCYSEIPTEFLEAKEVLKEKIVNWGFLESRAKYRNRIEIIKTVLLGRLGDGRPYLEDFAIHAIYDFTFEREVISSAHISISTADHEFFGVSMVEAAQVGCYCLVPNKLRNVLTGRIAYFRCDSRINSLGIFIPFYLSKNALKLSRNISEGISV